MTKIIEPVGPEVEVAAGGGFPNSSMLASGNYVVTWLDMVGPTNETLVGVYSSDGTQIGTTYSMTAATGYHALAPLASGGFVVVYTTTGQALAQIFDANGAPVGATFPLGSIDYYSNSTFDLEGLSNGGFAASWRNGTTVTIGTFDATGSPVATITPDVGEGTSAPQIGELADGTLVLTWHEYDRDSPYSGGYPDGYQVSGQLFDANGTALSPRFTVNQTQLGSHAESEIVALAGGGFVVTWVAQGDDNAGIWFQIYDETGTAVGSNIHASDLTPGYQSRPDIAVLSWGGFLITWVDSSLNNPENFDSGIRAQLFDDTGARVGETIQVNAQLHAYEVEPSVLITSDTEARIFYRSGGNADPSGLLERTIILPFVGTHSDDVLNGTEAEDRIAGLGGHDTIDGADGDDALDGGAGNDTLDGGAGVDTLSGGAGDDAYIIDSALDAVHEGANGGTDTIYVAPTGLPDRTAQPTLVFSDFTYTLATGQEVEVLVLDPAVTGWVSIIGNEFDNHLIGNEIANRLHGGDGDDHLEGGGGNDILISGEGTDLMEGGAGNDHYRLYNGQAVVVELAGAGYDTITVPGSFTLAAGVEVEVIETANWSLTTPDTLTGNEFGQVIRGNSGNNQLNGLGGNDELYGGFGNDLLSGGDGNDALDGGEGNDRIVYDAADTASQVTGGAGNDVLVVAGNAPTGFDLNAQGFEAAEVTRPGQSGDILSTVDIYNGNWQVVQATTNYADGSRVTVNADPTGAYDTRQVWYSYDPLGRLSSVDTIYDDDSRLHVNLDEDNSKEWSADWFVYDAEGRLDSEDVLYDGGSRTFINFDQADGHSWAQDWFNYDALGRLDSEDIVHDDGSHIFINLDQDDSQSWSQAWFSYDALGRLDTQDVHYDDGTRTFTNHDQAGTEPFQMTAMLYNSSGALTQQAVLWDDGTTTYTFF